MSDTTKDIDLLAFFLEKVGEGYPMRCDPEDASPWSRAIAALVAERDALLQRVAELEAHPPSDRDRELRERLVESALQGAARDAHMEHQAAEMGQLAVYMVDAAIAAMRKGEA